MQCGAKLVEGNVNTSVDKIPKWKLQVSASHLGWLGANFFEDFFGLFERHVLGYMQTKDPGS